MTITEEELQRIVARAVKIALNEIHGSDEQTESSSPSSTEGKVEVKQFSEEEFFKSDFMYTQIVNNYQMEQNIYNSAFINGNEEQINSMPIIQVIQKIFYELRRSSTKTVCNNIKEYLNKNLNNFLINPYGEEFAFESLFNKANKILKQNQFFLTSNQSGLVVSNIGDLGSILEDILYK